ARPRQAHPESADPQLVRKSAGTVVSGIHPQTPRPCFARVCLPRLLASVSTALGEGGPADKLIGCRTAAPPTITIASQQHGTGSRVSVGRHGRTRISRRARLLIGQPKSYKSKPDNSHT